MVEMTEVEPGTVKSEKFGLKAYVVDYEGFDYPRATVCGIDGSPNIMMFELSPENIDQIHGNDTKGISMSAAVYALVKKAGEPFDVDFN